MLDDYNTVQFQKQSGTPELIKRNDLNDFISIPCGWRKPVIQISFWTQDPNIKTGRIRKTCQNSLLIHDTLYMCFQSPRIRSIDCKNPHFYVLFKNRWSENKPIHLLQEGRSDSSIGLRYTEHWLYRNITRSTKCIVLFKRNCFSVIYINFLADFCSLFVFSIWTNWIQQSE